MEQNKITAIRLQSSVKVEKGKIVTTWDKVTKHYAVPKGKLVLDELKLVNLVSNELDSVYFDELGSAVAKAEEAWRKECDKLEQGKSNETEVKKKRIKADEACAKYAAYTPVVSSGDKFARLLALVITGSRFANIDRASYMLAALRSKQDNDTVKKAVIDYVNSTFDLAACDYVKPYKCGLNTAQVENLRKVATTATLKWTDKGITATQNKSLFVWQQVMLTVLADGFGLLVQSNTDDINAF